MLDDVVVLETGTRIAVGYAGALLRDAGATVIRLEPGDGDVLRLTSPSYAEYLHGGKGSVTLLDGAVADRVDVVICDEESATDPAVRDLHTRRPDVVFVSVSPYGLDGPYASTPATDFTLQAEAGISLVHPTGDRPSVAAGVPLAELTGGAAAANAAVIGLLADDAADAPVVADVSLFESAVALQQFPWLYNKIEHHSPYPLPQAPIPGIEEATDGWVTVVSVTPQQWKDFRRMAEIQALDDPRFETLNDRVDHAAEVTGLVRQFTRCHTVDELVELGAVNRVPIVPATTAGSIASLAPFRARGSFVRSASDTFIGPRPPFRVDGHSEYAPAALAAVGADDGSWTARTPRRRNRNDDIDPALPLAGLTVVEFGTFQAGPMVAENLANLGAEVIKVETVNRPDLIRFNGVPATVDRFWDRGAPFIGPNLGKQDITADLADPRGLAVVRDLIARADVVIENYGPRVLESRGLDYEGVRALNPDIIMVRMPAWGLDGPWRDRPGFTYTVNAASGMAELTGYADGEPLLTGTVVDPFAAFVSTFATVSAIRHRRTTGRGGVVEVPLCEAAIQLTAREVVEESGTSQRRSRTGNRTAGISPQGVYRGADARELALSVTSDKQWSALTSLPWAKAWADDDRFAVAAGRESAADEIDEHLRRACAELDSDRLVAELRSVGVPAARLEVGDDITDHPQLTARGRVVELPHPVIGDQKYLAGPIRFVAGPRFAPRAAAPLFGQHTEQILTLLGRSADEIAALRADGQIADSPFGLPFDRAVPPR